MIDLDELFKKLQDFGHRVMIAISIEAAGLLPPSYDKLLRKDEYGSVERDTRAENADAP